MRPERLPPNPSSPTINDQVLRLGRKRTGIMLASGSVGLFLGLSLIGHSGVVFLREIGLDTRALIGELPGEPADEYRGPSPWPALAALLYFLGCLAYVGSKVWGYTAVLSLRVRPDGLSQTILGRGNRHLRWEDITDVRSGIGRTIVSDADSRKVLIPALAMKHYGALLNHVHQNVELARDTQSATLPLCETAQAPARDSSAAQRS